MKRCSILLLVFAMLLYTSRAFSQDPAFEEKARKVTTVYDNKTDTTVVRFGPMHLITFYTRQMPVSGASENEEVRLTAFFTYKGKTLVKPESVALLFRLITRSTNRWELSRHKDLEITADDGHWKIPNAELVDSNGSVFLTESVGVAVPCGIFVKIAHAKKVKFRLGDRSFDLTKQHLTALRDLASRTEC